MYRRLFAGSSPRRQLWTLVTAFTALMFASVLDATPAVADTFAIVDSFVGASTPGIRHILTENDGLFSGVQEVGYLEIEFEGGADNRWSFTFESPFNDPFAVGVYSRAQRSPFQSPIRPGLSVDGEAGCNALEGSFAILELSISAGGELERLAIDFTQTCVEYPLTYRGVLRYRSDIPAFAPTPHPPSPTPTPAVYSTYIRLDSEPGGYIGAGAHYLLLPHDGFFSSEHETGHLQIHFDAGHENDWRFHFAAARGEELTVGRYSDAVDYPFGSPARPQISVSGNGRWCDPIGTFTIFEVEYDAEQNLKRLALDFDQICGGLLKGTIRINSLVPENMPTPTAPAPTATPSAYATYLRLSPQAFDYVIQHPRFYVPTNASFDIDYEREGPTYGEHVTIRVNGGSEDNWTLEFGAPYGERLRAGTFEYASRIPPPFRPRIDIYGSGRGCNSSRGRFHVADFAVDANGVVERLAIDFERRCDSTLPVTLAGSIRFLSLVPTITPTRNSTGGTPTATPSRTPTLDLDTASSYAVLYSDPGDRIGGGRTVILTEREGLFRTDLSFFPVQQVSFIGEASGMPYERESWSFQFAAPHRSTLAEGLYLGATRAAFREGSEPGIDINANGTGCDTGGEFAILEIATNADGSLERLAVDFEQHCGGATPALRGILRYRSTIPAGRATPTPPPPTCTPTRPTPTFTPIGLRSVLVIDSESGDPIGQGHDEVLTITDLTNIRYNPRARNVSIRVGEWSIEFAPLEGKDLSPGAYEDAQRYPFQSPLRPGLSVAGHARTCTAFTGRFYVFEADFSGNSVDRFAANFELRCGQGALRGVVRIASTVPIDAPVPTPISTSPTQMVNTTFAWLDGQIGEYISDGSPIRLLPGDGIFSIVRNAEDNAFGDHIRITFDGREPTWRFEFSVPIGRTLQAGQTYRDATRFPFQSPTRPGLSVGGAGRECNRVSGEFSVLELEVDENGAPLRFIASFTQYCDANPAVLQGLIAYNSSTAYAQPTATPTADPTLTFVRFDGSPGEFISQGRHFTLTHDAGRLEITHTFGSVRVGFLSESEYWTASLSAPPGSELVPGNYEMVRRQSSETPSAGIDAGGPGRACNDSTGTFTVFEAEYGIGTHIERFAADIDFHCNGGSRALRIAIRVNSSAPVFKPPPTAPVSPTTVVSPTSVASRTAIHAAVATPTPQQNTLPPSTSSASGGGCRIADPSARTESILWPLVGLFAALRRRHVRAHATRQEGSAARVMPRSNRSVTSGRRALWTPRKRQETGKE